MTVARTHPAGSRGMLVATKTRTVRDEDGTEVRLKAGLDRVAAGHFLTTMYPELFAPASEAAKYVDKSRAVDRDREWWKRLGLDSRPAEPPKWKPLIRFQDWADPTVMIRLSNTAYRAMTDLVYSERVRAYRNQGDVNETGGALFGVPPREQDRSVSIGNAGGLGPRARTSPDRMHVDCDHVRREAAELERTGSPQRWIGSWHTHPNDVDGRGNPSQADLGFFAWDCRECGYRAAPTPTMSR